MHGIRKECDECKKHGCPPPVYEIIMGESGDILVRIDSAPDAIVNAAIGEQITGSTNEYVGTGPVKALKKMDSFGGCPHWFQTMYPRCTPYMRTKGVHGVCGGIA